MKWTKLIAVSVSFSAFLFAGAALTNPSQALAATYTVTKTADTNDGVCDADCSLREAIAAANANAGHDTIEFDIPTSDAGYVPASGDVHAYWSLGISSFLSLTDNDGVFINGYSQTGASRNTAPFGETINTILTIQIVSSGDFVNATNAGSNHIAGLNVQAVSTGNNIFLASSDNNWIEGNFFGSDITGIVNEGSWGPIAVYNYAGLRSKFNVIGTNGDGVGDAGERNLFMTNTVTNNGTVYDRGEGTIIAGNYIGVNKTGRTCGTGSMKRQHIYLTDDSISGRVGTNYDGSSDSEEANIIACINTDHRALVRFGGTNSVVQGNFIGTNPHRDDLSSQPVPGIKDRSGTPITATIKGNTILYNRGIDGEGGGIVIQTAGSTGVTFENNIIYGNGSVADIDLGNYGLTLNDPGDTDTGPNDLMNYPEIQGAEWLGNGRYKIWGWLEGNLAEAPFTIEVCKASNHPSGHGGCLESLGTMTTSERMWSMEVTVSGDSEGSLSTFTALATNKNGSTSEFGPNFGGSIPGPGAPAPTPKKPDLLAMHSGFVQNKDVLSFAPPAAFLWDVYLDISHTPQTGTRRVSGAYWQASGIYNAWYKSFFNDAKIMPEVISAPYLLAIKYDPIKLDPNLPEGNLKLAYSEDGEVWKVLPNSVLDMVNKTVAVVTKQGGYYMLVSGYPR